MKDSKLKDTPIVKKDKFSLKQCSVSYLKKKEQMQKIHYVLPVGGILCILKFVFVPT